MSTDVLGNWLRTESDKDDLTLDTGTNQLHPEVQLVRRFEQQSSPERPDPRDRRSDAVPDVQR